jgi:hypothetical protein
MGTRRGDHVSDDRLRDLYAAAVKAGVATSGETHPAPEAIARLVRREGPEEARLATLDHVMGCAECRRDFDLLRTVERAGVQSGAAPGRAAGSRSWMVPTALAATLLLAVGVGRTLLTPADETTRGGDDSPVVLVAPGAEATAGDSLVFTWRPVAGASRYELELLDAGGGVAAAAATADTTASPSAATGLPPGDYHWWVRATTADARSSRSPLRPLRLTAR